MFPKSLIPLILMPLFLLCFPLSGRSEYPAAPRDTGIPPEPTGFLLTLGPEYRLLAESSQLRLFYREDRGIFAVADRRGGYVWKSGLDIPFNRDVEERLDEGADPLGLPPLEERLNTTFTGIANSIIAVEYYDRANNIRREGSSARENVRLSLSVIQNDPFLADLTVLFDELDLKITLRVELSGNRLLLRAEPEDIQGSGSGRLASIAVAPFMGASGGRRLLWDPLEEDWEISEPKEAPTGYAVVPDGSGALIRFQDNSTELSAYIGDVFGEDPSQAESFRRFADASVPHKTAHMPLFGMVHGSLQNAFAAFAASGGEYMEIAAVPEENTTFYTRAYPRFIYNRLYYQVYNQKGDGYFRLLEEPNRFTLEMHYEPGVCLPRAAGRHKAGKRKRTERISPCASIFSWRICGRGFWGIGMKLPPPSSRWKAFSGRSRPPGYPNFPWDFWVTPGGARPYPVPAGFVCSRPPRGGISIE